MGDGMGAGDECSGAEKVKADLIYGADIEERRKIFENLLPEETFVDRRLVTEELIAEEETQRFGQRGFVRQVVFGTYQVLVNSTPRPVQDAATEHPLGDGSGVCGLRPVPGVAGTKTGSELERSEEIRPSHSPALRGTDARRGGQGPAGRVDVLRQMVRAALLPLVAALTAAAASGSAPPPRSTQRFTIDLDREPEERFKEVAQHFKANILDFLKVIEGSAVKDIVEKIVKHRGPERSAELQAEIAGWAKYTGAPLVYAQVVHLLYELQTVMVPWENVTWPWGQTTRRTGLEPIFGCTGIIARSADSGTVTHARNMDFSFAKYFQNMSYLGTFVKNGKEVFTAQMIAPYSFPITAWRRGQNGYSVEINTRYQHERGLSHQDAVLDEKREASGWVRRQVLQSVDSFEEAVEAFSTRPYATTEYDIIAGVQKGVILARDPDSVYHKLTLGPNRNDYIIVTNFDYWDHDLKELDRHDRLALLLLRLLNSALLEELDGLIEEVLDPTSLHFGHARRVGAETLLNASGGPSSDLVAVADACRVSPSSP
ncbi:unnamed protein product [Prorocentrum cordatum]|uniref:Acid ceramidase N-terminal domain-containing protein n=1 Tax=Prorocentrum cordatum TaxID=2364126 RepID=A0ABN9TPR8_9DINO|nr:unnamed protein product [Polarella glacialis]